MNLWVIFWRFRNTNMKELKGFKKFYSPSHSSQLNVYKKLYIHGAILKVDNKVNQRRLRWSKGILCASALTPVKEANCRSNISMNSCSPIQGKRSLKVGQIWDKFVTNKIRTLSLGLKNYDTQKCWPNNFPITVMYLVMLENYC